MIFKDDFLKKLRSSFDLNEYEVKIWTALLSRGVSSAGELSEISNVPRSRSYDVLESLEKKGFIIMKLGKPIKYMAVKPEEIIRRIKSNLSKKAEEHVRVLDEIKKTDLYTELQLLHEQGIKKVDPSALSGALCGRDKVYDQIEAMVKNASKSITIMTTAKGLSRKGEILVPLIKKLKDVKIRIAAPITKENKDIADILKKYAEVRNIDKVNARFCMIDGKELLFMMMDDNKVHENYDTGVWVNTPYFASALEEMFNLTWNNLK